MEVLLCWVSCVKAEQGSRPILINYILVLLYQDLRHCSWRLVILRVDINFAIGPQLFEVKSEVFVRNDLGQFRKA